MPSFLVNHHTLFTKKVLSFLLQKDLVHLIDPTVSIGLIGSERRWLSLPKTFLGWYPSWSMIFHASLLG